MNQSHRRWILYCHTHIESGRRYIGLTCKTMMARWNGHLDLAKRSNGLRSHFIAAIRKYGKEAFSHEVLAMSWDLEGANATEETLIEFFDTRNPEKGFNLMRGGGHTPHPMKNPWDRLDYRERKLAQSRELFADPNFVDGVKQRLSEIRARPDHSEKISKSITGRILSAETCAKLSAARLGKATNEIIRSKISSSSKSLWSDSVYRERVLNEIQKSRSYTLDTEGNLVSKTCLVHGEIPASSCRVGTRSKFPGRLRIECRLCNIAASARKRAKFV